MKRFLITLSLILSCCFATAQETNYNAFRARNAFYIEVGGQTWTISLNYERRYHLSEKTRLYWHVGVGEGGFSFAPEPNYLDNFSVPVGLSASYGKGRHQLEGGLGTTMRMQFDFNTGNNNTSNPAFRGKVKFMGVPHIGYRYSPPIGGLVIRVIYSPIFRYINHRAGLDRAWRPWFGVSIGYALRNVEVG